MPRKTKETWKIYANVFDNFTLRDIFKLSSQGHFEAIKSPIALGKEANIFSAEKEDGKFVIVKIYRLDNCNFNRMYDYLKTDPRFTKIKKGKRSVALLWVKREFKNLMKARKAGVNVPTPIAVLDNIIVMELIGIDRETAFQLKDHYPKDPKDFLKKIIKNLKVMYKKAGLVHGDLSQFNILNLNENPVFIDMSQATTIENVRAEELLKRDIEIICRFFKKLNVRCDADRIIKEVKK